MRVKFLEDHSVRVSPLSTRTYPKGWEGEIDDKIANAAVKAKAAEKVKADDPPAGKDDGSKAAKS